MSYCEEYKAKVKQAVCELLDWAYKGKFNILTFDTDEDSPFVDAWVFGKSVKVYGWVHGRVDGIYPSNDDDTWSFLECCEKALAEIQKIVDEIQKSAAPMSETKGDE